MVIRIILVTIIFIYFVFINIDYARLRKKYQEMENRLKMIDTLNDLDDSLKEFSDNIKIIEVNAENDDSSKN